MNAVIALCHFCELHGPSVLFTTQSYHSLDPKHVLECDENAPDGVSYYIKERSLRSTSSDDGSLSKAVKSDTCEACRSLSSGQSGYISNDHRAHVSYVSTQYPDHPQVFAMVRQACVRSLSCEVCPGREGPIFFGDDTRGHVFSYTFYIQDAQARGFTRWYSVIVVMMDKTYLLNSWPFLVQHVRKFVAWLQAKARVVHDSEQARCPQRAQRLSSSMTPSNFRQHRGENIPARSLSDLTNDKSVFRNLHVRFSWLLKHCGSRLTEKLLEGPPTEDSMIDTEIDDDLSEDSVSAVTPDLDFDPDRPEHVENPCHVETTCADDATTGNVFEATSQVRGYEEPAFHNIRHVVKVLGEDKFHTLSHHVLIGNQLVVRSNQSTITSSLIHCLKALLPKGCCRAINYSSTYEDSWRCSFIGLPKTVPIPPHVLSSELHLVVEVKSRNVSETADRVENFYYGLHSEALLPERGPIILTKMEKVIANRELSDDVVEQCIICLKEEWMNKVKAVFMFSKTGTSRTEAENKRMLSLFGVDREEDKRVMKYWMTGLSVQYKSHMLSASVHQCER